MNTNKSLDSQTKCRVKNIGEDYYSGDFSIPSGAVVDVPEKKATQLLQDFPKNWQLMTIPVVDKTECIKKSALIMIVHDSRGLEVCLDSLYANTPAGFQLTVVQNKNEDAKEYKMTAMLLGKKTKKYGFKVLKAEINQGYAANCNLGAKNSDRQYLVFLNSDLEFVDGNWLAEMIAQLTVDRVGISEPRLFDRNGGEFSRRKSYWVCGACFAIKSSVFFELSGFDENYRLYWEETDLCEAAHRAGFEASTAEIKVIHDYKFKYDQKFHIDAFKAGEAYFIKKWGNI